MLCFEVSINGEKLGVAGVGPYGVPAVMLNLRSYDSEEINTKGELTQSLNLWVGGMAEEEHLTWMYGRFAVGDYIVVRIVDVIEADSPVIRDNRGRDGRRSEFKAIKRKFENDETAEDPIQEVLATVPAQVGAKTCFEISLNRRKLSLIGISSRGEISSTVTWVKVPPEQLTSKRDPRQGVPRLEAGGLIGDESLHWLDRRVKVGDLISYRIFLCNVADAPVRRN